MTPAVVEIRDHVQNVMRRHVVIRASVFGSVARGDDTLPAM
jgi:predicted nucleotidyltransferase